jgi:hypothetical protein
LVGRREVVAILAVRIELDEVDSLRVRAWFEQNPGAIAQ